MTAPICPPCNAPCRFTTGAEIYPRRPDLADKKFWKCPKCSAYVGCHPGTHTPLGDPADAATRKARMLLHNDMLDPLWKTNAHRGKARGHVYTFLGIKMGLPPEKVHTGMFSVEQCREAWRALSGLSYSDIRDFVQQNRGKAV